MRFLFVLAGFAAAGTLSAQDSAARAIREAYARTNDYYERKDLKELAGTILPSFYAVDEKGRRISHEQIETSIARRFAVQQECWRDEHAVSVKVSGTKAIVPFDCQDQYVSFKPGLGRVFAVEHSMGVSYWVKAPGGWKQEHLAFTTSTGQRFQVGPNWHIPTGGWHSAERS